MWLLAVSLSRRTLATLILTRKGYMTNNEGMLANADIPFCYRIIILLFGKMFNKNFASHQQKDAAAEDFGFGLVTTSEDISDAQTNH